MHAGGVFNGGTFAARPLSAGIHRLHVADIASRTGFNSLSHFNRVFLRQVGMPPLQYRKALSRHGEERATGTEQGLFLP